MCLPKNQCEANYISHFRNLYLILDRWEFRQTFAISSFSWEKFDLKNTPNKQNHRCLKARSFMENCYIAFVLRYFFFTKMLMWWNFLVILAEFAEVNMSNKMWKLLKRLTCCSNILSENYEDFVILFFNLDMSKLTVILSLTWGGGTHFARSWNFKFDDFCSTEGIYLSFLQSVCPSPWRASQNKVLSQFLPKSGKRDL